MQGGALQLVAPSVELLHLHPRCWLAHGRSPVSAALATALEGILNDACFLTSVLGPAFQSVFWSVVLWFDALFVFILSILAMDSFSALNSFAWWSVLNRHALK